jgi:hypothetical protein
MKLPAFPRHFLLGCLCGWLLLFSAAPAEAQSDPGNTAAARQLGFEGIKDYQAGRFQEATDKLERAYSLVQAPTIGLWSARALVKTGKLVAAAERYLETTRLPLPQANQQNHKKAQQDAALEREALLPRIASLRVDVAGAPVQSVEVRMDGVLVGNALLAVARPVDPGAHRVVATWRGREQSQQVTLREGDHQTLTLTFAPDVPALPVASPAAEAAATPPAAVVVAPAAPSTSEGVGKRKMLAYVALGIGAAGIATGAITGFAAISKKRELDGNPNCQNGGCTPAAYGDVDTLNTLRSFSTAGFVVGALGVGTGVALILLGGGDHHDAAAEQARLLVGPGQLGVAGRF